MHIFPISEERKKVTIKNWYIPRFEGYSRYFTDIAHAYFDYVITMASACACFTDSDQNFWWKLYQIENLWSKLVSDGDLEILLDNSDDVNTNELVKYVVTHSLEVYRWQCS